MLNVDLIIRNANIRTMDPDMPVAGSLAAVNGRIIAVSVDDDLGGLAGPDTVVLDLAGRTATPGFIDAHQHLSWFAENGLNLDVSPESAGSISEILDLISREAERLGEGEWVRAMRYDDAKTVEKRRLTRDDLDRAAPNNPVIVVQVSGHWAVVNSMALKAGGLNRDAGDPEGGSYGRDPETGRLNGLMLEMAMFNFAFESMAVTPTVVPPYPRDVRLEAVQKATAILNESGITGAGDALCSPQYINTYLELANKGLLTVRVNMIVPQIFLGRLESCGLTGGWGNEWARAAGIKFITDGAIAGHTAAMKNGYADDPDDHGLLLIEDQAVLNDLVRRSHELGYQACIHANGDEAIEMALEAMEKAMKSCDRPGLRHRIEHCTLVTDKLLERIARLNIIAVPFTSYIWQHAEKLRPYYGDRADRMFAHGSFLKAGITAASGSDHPVGLHPPLLGVQCMVTRKTPDGEVIGPDEKISVTEAFKVYTVNAAAASGESLVKGSLTPGRLADMIVLDQDPWTIDPDRISGVRVDMTIVNGNVVYEAESS